MSPTFYMANAAALSVLMVLSPSTHASDYAAGRTITLIGCHHGDGTCFVTLSGASFGANEG